MGRHAIDFSVSDKAPPNGCVRRQLQLTLVHLPAPQQIDNRSHRTGHAHTVNLLNVAPIDMRPVKNEDFWNHAIAPEVSRHGRVQLRGHNVRQFVKAERGFMTVDPLGDFLPVLRPEIPEHKVRSLRCGKIGEPVNSTVLPNPVSRIYVVGMRLLREDRPHTRATGTQPCETS